MRIRERTERLKLSCHYRLVAPMRHAVREIAGSLSPIGPPVVVYTMEKVGTQTVLATLRASSHRQRAYMTHTVKGSVSLQARRSLPLDLIQIRGQQQSPLKLITAVRDPVARDISLFFEVLPLLMPSVDSLTPLDELSVEFGRFVSNESEVEYLTPTSWFEEEFFPATDLHWAEINIDPDLGWSRNISKRFDLLTFRTEQMGDILEPALTSFLGRPIKRRIDHNRHNQKRESVLLDYYGLYRSFVHDAKLESAYLDRSYQDPVVRHFYSDEEISSARLRWLR